MAEIRIGGGGAIVVDRQSGGIILAAKVHVHLARAHDGQTRPADPLAERAIQFSAAGQADDEKIVTADQQALSRASRDDYFAVILDADRRRVATLRQADI